jgi:preprotein translocase subunit SecY
VGAFSSVMIYILLIPLDVFVTVRHIRTLLHFYDPIFKTNHNIHLYDLYFTSYIIMILMTFIGLPFSYFYAQTVQDEEDKKMASQSEKYME